MLCVIVSAGFADAKALPVSRRCSGVWKMSFPSRPITALVLAKAGIRHLATEQAAIDSRLRGNDRSKWSD